MRVVTFGSFDLFHYGHLRLLERAYKLNGGKPITVYLSTDEFHKEKKGSYPICPYAHREAILLSLYCVKAVHSEREWSQKEALDESDLLVMGSDWVGKFDDLYCMTVYLPRTEGVSTTEIKERIRNE